MYFGDKSFYHQKSIYKFKMLGDETFFLINVVYVIIFVTIKYCDKTVTIGDETNFVIRQSR